MSDNCCPSDQEGNTPCAIVPFKQKMGHKTVVRIVKKMNEYNSYNFMQKVVYPISFF